MAEKQPVKQSMMDRVGLGLYAAGGGDAAEYMANKEKAAFEEWKQGQTNSLQEREIGQKDFEIKKEFGTTLQAAFKKLKSKYGKNKEKAWADFQEDYPLLKELYGGYIPDFDNKVKGMFEGYYTPEAKSKSIFGGLTPVAGGDLMQQAGASAGAAVAGLPPQARQGMMAGGIGAMNPQMAMQNFLQQQAMKQGQRFGSGFASGLNRG